MSLFSAQLHVDDRCEFHTPVAVMMNAGEILLLHVVTGFQRNYKSFCYCCVPRQYHIQLTVVANAYTKFSLSDRSCPYQLFFPIFLLVLPIGWTQLIGQVGHLITICTKLLCR